MINGQTSKAQGAAARLPLNENLNGFALEDDGTLQQLDEVTLAAAKSAKHYRIWMLENVKVDITAASDCANGLGSADQPPGFADRTAGQPCEREDDSDTLKLERQLPQPAAAAVDYRAKAAELINANVNATLDYALELANVRSLVEYIELSTNHARRHFALIMKYAAVLTASSRSVK